MWNPKPAGFKSAVKIKKRRDHAWNMLATDTITLSDGIGIIFIGENQDQSEKSPIFFSNFFNTTEASH